MDTFIINIVLYHNKNILLTQKNLGLDAATSSH